MAEDVDLAVVGAGAAGLMAAIWAARTAPQARVVVFDGAERLGAKILIAGGGRCNVTHEHVEAVDFAGSTGPAIRKVLRRFDVPETVAFFRALGVTLKRESTGKLFPTTDQARTVRDALVGAARDAGVELRHPWRVQTVTPGFELEGPAGSCAARRVIVATGGSSVPKTGSDGHGFALLRALGHSTTSRIFPALVPLRLPPGHPLTALTGLSADVALTVESATGARLARVTGALLCTHGGLSGPAVLDVSRWWIDAHADDRGARLVVSWCPAESPDDVDRWLREAGAAHVRNLLATRLPDRLAAALVSGAGVDPATPAQALTRVARRALVVALTAMPLPITGHRGFAVAEATAGGVPLRELRLETLESRHAPGLHVCGEVCDVDGRIGGFNFQWAWASGYVAGVGAARALAPCDAAG